MNTPSSSSGLARVKQQVYVAVPLSPYPLSRHQSINKAAPVHVPTGKLKENAPLKLSHVAMDLTPQDIRKRKISERDNIDSKDVLAPKGKKQRLANAALSATAPASNACPEFPNGYVYCHQCYKKRNASECIHCTFQCQAKGRAQLEGRCIINFCKSCLKNRYGEDVDVIKSGRAGKKEKGHVEKAGYIFKCPKCRDICNCARCRKAKGLQPTGNLTLAVRKAGGISVAQALANDPKITGPMRGKVALKAEAPNMNVGSTKSLVKPLALKTQPRVTKQSTIEKQLPLLAWTPVPTYLDLKDAEARFQIREFILRFGSIMEPKIPKSQLAELDDVGCGSRTQLDDEELAGWVSEACVRSIVLGVLGFLADKSHGLGKPVRCAIEDIRTSGVNLSKIWSILATLRSSANRAFTSSSFNSGDLTALTFPDPLPPPTSIVQNIRITRSLRDTTGPSLSIAIVHPGQMIPVIQGLIESAHDTNAVREELDRGIQEGKEITREVKEYVKLENERWDMERKDLEASLMDKEKVKGYTRKVKVQRDMHKRRVENIENALKLILPACAPRFSHLGTDSAGRSFWALLPGASERKIARDFITSAASGFKDSKKRPRARAFTEDERSAMRDWSSFVLLWGKKPHGVPTANSPSCDEDEGNEDEDEDVEKWWGFYDPGEILKLAGWVRVEAGIDSEDEMESKSSLSSLAKALEEYAALLEWRLRDDRYD
ncbi:hypothetical protein Hypma_007645 [Hypsizygus marmoreus]|uniref:Zinc-finger domain-containing protein n=1 Tax=Hypsizygus marmoreus TaxID=39966 RepID=A0A369JXN4_HYPMA|nr:hypothetical protein Hypma_007645 [Hypsizygus marmoreus]